MVEIEDCENLIPYVGKIMSSVVKIYKNIKKGVSIYKDINDGILKLLIQNQNNIYLEDIMQGDLVENVIEKCMSSGAYRQVIDAVLSQYDMNIDKKIAVKKFLQDMEDIIIEAQKKHVTSDDAVILKNEDKHFSIIDGKLDKLIAGSTDSDFKPNLKDYMDNIYMSGALDNLRQIGHIINRLNNKDILDLSAYFDIVLALYCSRDLLQDRVNKYFAITKRDYDELVLELLLVNNLYDLLDMCLENVKNESVVLKYKNLKANIDRANCKISSGKSKILEINISGDIDARALFNYFYSHKKYSLLCLSCFTEIINPYFIDKIRYVIVQMELSRVGDVPFAKNKKDILELFSELSSYSSVVKQLDVTYRIDYYQLCLMHIGLYNPEIFNQEYEKLDEEVKNRVEIKGLYFSKKIIDKEFNLMQITEFIIEHKYYVLINHVDAMFTYNINRIEYYEEYTELLRSSIVALNYYCKALIEEKCYEKLYKKITAYEKWHKDELIYKCLCLQCKNIKHESCDDLIKECVLTIGDGGGFTPLDLIAYIETAYTVKSFDMVNVGVNWDCANVDTRLGFIKFGNIAEKEEDILWILAMCNSIIKNANVINELVMSESLYARGALNIKLNKIDEALADFNKSLLLNRTNKCAVAILEIKIKTYDYSNHSAIDICKEVMTFDFQGLVGSFYLQSNNYDEAYKYFMRSILIQPVDNCAGGALASIIIYSKTNREIIDYIEKDVVVSLKNNSDVKNIVLHREGIILQNMVVDDYLNCKHYSIDDIAVNDLTSRRIGDEVIFNNEKYVIEKIDNLESHLIMRGFQWLEDNGQAKFFRGEINDAINELSMLLKESSAQTNKILDAYYKSKQLMPLKFVSQLMDVNLLNFLELESYNDSKKIGNINNTALNGLDENYIIHLDTLYMFTKLNWDLAQRILKDCNFHILKSSKLYVENEILKLKENIDNGISLSYDSTNGKLVQNVMDEGCKRNISLCIKKLNEMMNSMNVIDNPCNCTYVGLNKDIKDSGGDLELAMITIAQRDNLTILTDNGFMNCIASENKVSLQSIICLLAKYINKDVFWDQLKILANCNFGRYINIDVLYALEKNINTIISDDDKNIQMQKYLDFLNLDYGDEVKNKYHRDLVISLHQEVVANKICLDRNITFYLERVAVHCFVTNNPDYVQEHLANMQYKFNIGENGISVTVEDKHKSNNEK